MVIDRTARSMLSVALRKFANGQITNDEFDDFCYDQLPASDDSAIQEIPNHGFVLINDMQTFKFKGKYRLSREQRRHVAKVIMFLQSDAEYKWPHLEDNLVLGCFKILLFGEILCSAICFVLAVIIMVTDRIDHFSSRLFFGSSLLLFTGVVFLLIHNRLEDEKFNEYKSHGNYDCWPFIDNDQLESEMFGRKQRAG